jgi:hypothetical protein
MMRKRLKRMKKMKREEASGGWGPEAPRPPDWMKGEKGGSATIGGSGRRNV